MKHASIGIFGLSIIVIALAASSRSFAAEKSSEIPSWLRAHVGEGEDQIAQVVLQRARALYLQKEREGAVKNPCYVAMDATRPNEAGNGASGHRFYVICEADYSFRAISAGHGGGRDLKGTADFANGRRCAKNSATPSNSRLTAGGAYVTRETKTSFKGYYRVSPKQNAVLIRLGVKRYAKSDARRHGDGSGRQTDRHSGVLRFRGVEWRRAQSAAESRRLWRCSRSV